MFCVALTKMIFLFQIGQGYGNYYMKILLKIFTNYSTAKVTNIDLSVSICKA